MNSHLNKIGYLLFLNLSIISGILIALNLFGVIDTKFIASNNTFSTLLIIFLTGMIFCKYNLDEHYHRYNSFARSIVDSSQYFFLSLLILIVANKFLKLDILSDRILILTATAIGFGFLTFYKNRDRVEIEIENEKQKEEDEEKQRYHDFEYKFQNINRIPILRNIVRWMYKEGWVYSITLLFITLFSLTLIFWNLKKSLWIDETYSYIAINSIMRNLMPILDSGLYYFVSLPYLYLQAFMLYIFSDNEVIFRIINIFFYILTLFFGYNLIKNIFNKKLALWSIIALALTYNFLMVIQLGRHYPLFIFLITFYMYLQTIHLPNIKRNLIELSIILFSILTHTLGIILLEVFIIRQIFLSYKNKKVYPLAIAFLLGIFSLIILYLNNNYIQQNGFIYLINSFKNVIPNLQNHINFFINTFGFEAIILLSLGFIFWQFINLKKSKFEINLFIILTMVTFILFIPDLSFRYISFLTIFILGFSLLFVYLISYKKSILFISLTLVTLIIFFGLTFFPSDLEKFNYDLPTPDYKKVYSSIDYNPGILLTSATWGGSPAKTYLNNFDASNHYIYNNVEGSYSLFTYIDKNNIKDKYSNSILINSLDQYKRIEENYEDAYFILDHNRLPSINLETLDYLRINYQVDYNLSDNEITVFKKNKISFSSSFVNFYNIQQSQYNDKWFFNLIPKNYPSDGSVVISSLDKSSMYLSILRKSQEDELSIKCGEFYFEPQVIGKTYNLLLNVDEDASCTINLSGKSLIKDLIIF